MAWLATSAKQPGPGRSRSGVERARYFLHLLARRQSDRLSGAGKRNRLIHTPRPGNQRDVALRQRQPASSPWSAWAGGLWSQKVLPSRPLHSGTTSARFPEKFKVRSFGFVSQSPNFSSRQTEWGGSRIQKNSNLRKIYAIFRYRGKTSMHSKDIN